MPLDSLVRRGGVHDGLSRNLSDSGDSGLSPSDRHLGDRRGGLGDSLGDKCDRLGLITRIGGGSDTNELWDNEGCWERRSAGGLLGSAGMIDLVAGEMNGTETVARELVADAEVGVLRDRKQDRNALAVLLRVCGDGAVPFVEVDSLVGVERQTMEGS